MKSVMRKLVLTLSGVLLLGISISGCARSRADDERDRMMGLRGIPVSAKLLRDSRGSMSMTAPSLGRVYLYDFDDGAIAWSGMLESGQRFAVNPGEDRVSIDKNLAYHRVLDGTHRHRIYFDPAN
jgi:hypothetical protein